VLSKPGNLPSGEARLSSYVPRNLVGIPKSNPARTVRVDAGSCGRSGSNCAASKYIVQKAASPSPRTEKIQRRLVLVLPCHAQRKLRSGTRIDWNSVSKISVNSCAVWAGPGIGLVYFSLADRADPKFSASPWPTAQNICQRVPGEQFLVFRRISNSARPINSVLDPSCATWYWDWDHSGLLHANGGGRALTWALSETPAFPIIGSELYPNNSTPSRAPATKSCWM
jgi:hypothetical protein